MGKTFLSLSDQITTWVNKHNNIVNNIGDMANLTGAVGAANDSDLVTAIGYVHNLAASGGVDSAGVLAVVGLTAGQQAQPLGTALDSADLNSTLILYDSTGTAVKTVSGLGA